MRSLITICLAVCSICAEAKIITTDKIKDIEVEFAQADNETLVIFDYDDVLLEPVDLALLTINEDASDKIADDIIKNKNIEKSHVAVALSMLTRDMKT